MSPPPARLRVSLHSSVSTLELAYTTSRGDAGSVTLHYPIESPVLIDTAPAVGLAVAVYLGQLCLAPYIELDYPTPVGAICAIAPLARMLYDVRRWKDGLPIGDPPIVVTPGEVNTTAYPGARNPRRTMLLWSGGKDSTLAAHLLRQNGFDVSAVHATANVGVQRVEQEAVADLASTLRLCVHTIEVSHPEFLRLSSRCAKSWNQFPYCNTVPFGRDLLLAAAAAPLAAALDISYLSFGHDNDCRRAVVDHPVRSFPRNDVESLEGALVLAAYLNDYVVQGLSLLPPLAGLPELRILHDMLVRHPALMAKTSFCFWGGPCGRCAKCLRYDLAQRVFIPERPVLRFDVLS